jgi:predicted kinase
VYVLVSGLPGSGKTSVAVPLAAALGWPLLAKDTIKESLWDVLGPGDRAWSARLGGAAQELVVALAADAPNAVLDTFVHHEWKHRLASLPGPLVEVHCSCAPEVARRRFAERQRHPCHFDAELLVETWDRWLHEDAEPLALGPVLQVDTTDAVDLDAIVAWLRRTGVTDTPSRADS